MHQRAHGFLNPKLSNLLFHLEISTIHICPVGPKQQELIPLQAGHHMTPVTIDYTSVRHFVGVY